MSRQQRPDYASFQARLKRRSISVSALLVAAIVATLSAPIWIAVAIAIDAVRLRWRFPLARLLLFGWYWSIIECAGVLISLGLWMSGQSKNQVLHYRLMGWWAGKLMTGLRIAMRASIDVNDSDAFDEGNAVVLCRHASLADSLVSAWVVCTNRGLSPRYVLKRELLWDPCLDIVGQRVPNAFVHRGGADADGDLERVRSLTQHLGAQDCIVLFPEGTRSPTGQMRRFKTGAFENTDAVVEEVHSDKGMLDVSVNFFGRPTPMSLGYWEVELI